MTDSGCLLEGERDMSSENSPIDLTFRPKLEFPTAKEIEEIVAQIPDEDTRRRVESAIDSECVEYLPYSVLSDEAFSKLEDFIGGMEIVGIRLDNTWPGWIGIHIKVLAFAREDGAVEFRRRDDVNYWKEPVLAVLTEPPTLEEMIQMVIEAIEGTSEISWKQIFCRNYDGEIDYGARCSVSSKPYPELTRWFEEEIKKYIEECESYDEDEEDE